MVSQVARVQALNTVGGKVPLLLTLKMHRNVVVHRT